MAELEYGVVRGRYRLVQSNVSRSAVGTVLFTPVEPDEIVDVPEETLYSRQPVEGVFDGDGWIHAQGTPVDYLRLPVGRWEVSFRQAKGLSIGTFQFDVTADETVNLPAVAPLKPTPAINFVVNELVYTETLDARDETFVARDVAVQAAADAVAPTNTVVDARIAVKRGAANGVAALGSDSKLPETQVPDRLSAAQLSSTIGAAVTEGVAPKANAADVYSKATARAIFKPNVAPAIDLLGDSISAQCGGAFPTGTQPSGATYPPTSDPQARGYISHALTLLGQRLRFGKNFGIGGTTAAQMVARVADVLASTSPIVHVYAGTNDLGNGRTATETKTSLLAIYQALRAAGREVTTATIAPTVFIAGSAITNASGIAAGVTSFTAPAGAGVGDVLTLGPGTANVETVTVQAVSGPASGVYTITLNGATTKSHARGDLFRNVTRLARLHDVNQWVIDYTQGRYIDPATGNVVTEATGGIHLVDWHSLNADPATGQPFGSIQVDGTVTTVAQNPYVGVVDGVHPGQDLAHRMGHALAVVLDRILPPSSVRTGDNTDVGNLLTNGRAVGNSSGRPTGWSVITSVGTFTATPTKVARTDGIPGEYAQLAIGPGNTGQGQYRVGDVSGLTFDGVSAWTLEVEFETDANLLMQTTPPGGARPLAASVEFRTSSGSIATAHSHFTASSTDGAGSLWDASGVLRTGPFTPPATATRVLADVILQGIDTGTVRIKTARLRKVA